MRDEPGDDFKSMWQNQPAETNIMTMKLIQSKARELHAKTRRQLLGTLAGPLAAAFLYFFGTRTMPSLQPLLQPLFAVALIWAIAGLYFLSRGMWSAALPEDVGLSTCLEFCRLELARRGRLLRGVLVWSFGPILLAIGTLILGVAMIGTRQRGILPNGLPFLFLVVVWIVAYFVMRLRERREIEREIGLLDEIERLNRTAEF
jgi:MFS family permease